MNHRITNILIVLCTISATFFSCEKDIVDYGLDQYYEEIATAQEKNVFLLDNGKTLFNTNENVKQSYQSGDRVYLNYTLLPESHAGQDYAIRMNYASKVSLGKPKPVSLKDINASDKEPVRLESVWLGGRFLNIFLHFDYKSEAHSLGLLVDSTRLSDNPVRLYLVHATNKDPAGYPVNVFLSFDLEETLGKPVNEKSVEMEIVTSNYGIKRYELKY